MTEQAAYDQKYHHGEDDDEPTYNLDDLSDGEDVYGLEDDYGDEGTENN